MLRYPIQVNLQGKRCVVVGAGAVAERKAASLRACGGNVLIVAPQATPTLQALVADGAIQWLPAAYQAGHLDGAFLVIAATDAREVNASVTRDATARGLLVCATDDPEGGSFVSPAVVTRGDLQITVSTGGQSPTLAAVVREDLEAQFGPEWAAMAALMGMLRPQVQAAGNEAARRAGVRRVLADAGVWEALRGGDHAAAEARARRCLSS